MNKTAIKNFAIWARNKLIAEITYKAGLYGITENGIAEELPASTDNLKVYDIGMKEPAKVQGDDIFKRESLVTAIKTKAEKLPYKEAFQYIIEEAAYTWFNRLIAIRFMEVNDYLPSGVRVLSSESAGKKEPDMVTTPFETDIDFTDADKIEMQNLQDDELFRFLFIKECHKLNDYLPELFDRVDNYMELLLNISFRDEDGVVYHLVNDIPEKDFDIETEDENGNIQGQVQIIGWLYQYYNIEPKAKVFNRPSKEKIKSEEIPAATQLFTPDWIVRYMVENSLGKIYVDVRKHEGINADGRGTDEIGFEESENIRINTEKRIAEEMGWKYYIPEAVQTPDIRKALDEKYIENPNLKIESIKFFDPCMGSSHILVSAFDIFMQIYKSQGYTPRDAAVKIVQKNLYGADIDKRAYQLAYFALMMKARRYDRRFLTRGIKPNIVHFQNLDSVQNAVVDGALKELADSFKNCDTYGSLIEMKEIDGLDEALDGFTGVIDMGFEQTERMMRIYRLFTQKYDVVCTNPPYMAVSGANNTLVDFVKKNYPDSKSDLFAVFIEKCGKFAKQSGFYAMITQHAFMFLSSYEKLREKLLAKTTVNMAHLGARAFDEIGGEVVQTTAFVHFNTHIKNYKGTYARLVDVNGEAEKEKLFLSGEKRYTVNQENFSKIPGSPMAYWVSENFVRAFENKTIGEYGEVITGMTIGDNNKYLRLWFEVPNTSINLNKTFMSQIDIEKNKWIPYSKGGTRRNWYGNYEYVVNWSQKNNFNRSKTTFQHLYLREAITWPFITSGDFSARLLVSGFLWDVAGSPCFFNDKGMEYYVLGFMASKICNLILHITNPTINVQAIDVARLPLALTGDKNKINHLVEENIEISKADWDSFETSWDFKRHPLLDYMAEDEREIPVVRCGINGEYSDTAVVVYLSVENAFLNWQRACDERFNTLKKNEEELNRIFIDIYGLQDELTPEVEDKDVTVRKADLQREIKSLISYAVGCMFGRYSLDREGLVFAGGNFDDVYWKYQGQAALDKNGNAIGGGYAGMSEAEYHYPKFRDSEEYETATDLSFEPDVDNCIPITDTDYFDDDIVGRFITFVKTVYGEDTLEENLDFIANALGTKGNTSRQKIRSYFLGDFIKDHNKIYQKRPIYWLFDSGRQNGFKALVYMHRWNADTIGNVRVSYLHKLQRIYEKEIDRIQDIIDNESGKAKSSAEKQKDKLTKQLKETRDYDAKIAHLALSRIDIDLDDGVKVNYEKVQTGQDGKKIEILAKI